jgi:hypothetical protein
VEGLSRRPSYQIDVALGFMADARRTPLELSRAEAEEPWQVISKRKKWQRLARTPPPPASAVRPYWLLFQPPAPGSRGGDMHSRSMLFVLP